jgi:hypothetical protein
VKETAVQVAPAASLSAAFVRKAKALDERIQREIAVLGRGIVSLGKLFRQAKDDGIYVPLGFKTFGDYIDARTTDKGKSQIYEAMRVVRELSGGDKPAVSDADLDQMPSTNAAGLARLKAQGTRITPKLIDAAKTLPVKRFETEIMFPKLPAREQAKFAAKQGKVVAGATDVTINLTYSHVRPETAAAMNRAAEIFRKIGYDSSLKPEIKFEDQFLQAVAAEFESTHGPEYEEEMQNEEAEGVGRAVAASETMGPAVIEEEETDIDEDQLEPAAGGDGNSDDDEDGSTDEDEDDED